jgi:chorismate mutase
MEKELDLKQTIRPGLDILANEIVISLKKRSRFKQNLEIYSPGIVIGRADLSLLLYELARVEQQHAELGRYLYANQEAFTDVRGIEQVIRRKPPESPICNFPTNLGEEAIDYYIEWIKNSCAPGTDSDTFGETVTADVNALLNMFERINLGKYVAESKFKENPEAFRNSGGNPEIIKNLIVQEERENKVLEMVTRLADLYEFSREQAQTIFRWIIDTTVKVETQYIQRRLKASETFRA